MKLTKINNFETFFEILHLLDEKIKHYKYRASGFIDKKSVISNSISISDSYFSLKSHL